MTFIRCVERVWNRLVTFVVAIKKAFVALVARLRWVPATAVLGVALIGGAANAATWHVIGAGGSDSNDGDDWAEGLETIQEAISRASANDEIWVKAGEYVLGSANESFDLKDGVDLHGGFVGTETVRTDADPDANPTILDGDGVAAHVVTAENLYASLTRLDGFIITGGDAGGEGTGAQGGGLLYIADWPPISRLNVTRCRFEGNHADGGGGAVAVIRPGDAPTQTTFEVTFTNCKFSGNTSASGGAAYIRGGPVFFHNSLFYDNDATGNGGAIFADLFCDEFDDCDIRLCQLQDGSEAVTNCCTFSKNHAGGQGGAVYLIKASILNSTGSIFWGNTRDNGGTPVANQFAIEDVCSVLSVTFSCIEGGHSGTGNTANNPLFVNPSQGHFQLKSESSAVDTGAEGLDFPDDLLDFDHDGDDNEELAPDLDRHERIIMADIDMGAYERLCGCEGDTVTSATFAPPPDGVVDAADLAYLLGEWGANPGSPSDIVTSLTFAPPPDGVVDAADLAWLLGSWGTCTEECEEAFGGGDPFEGTEIGDLLDQLLEEEDEEAAAALAAELLELLQE